MITIKLEDKNDILALFMAIKEMTEPQQAERWFGAMPLGDFNARSAVREVQDTEADKTSADMETAYEKLIKVELQARKTAVDEAPADVKIVSEEPGIVKPLAVITQSGYATLTKWRSLYKPSTADVAKHLEVDNETAARLMRSGGWTQELAEKLASFVPGLTYENGKLTGDISKVTAPEKPEKADKINGKNRNKPYNQDVYNIHCSYSQNKLSQKINVAQTTIKYWLDTKQMPANAIPKINHALEHHFYLDDDGIIKVEV